MLDSIAFTDEDYSICLDEGPQDEIIKELTDDEVAYLQSSIKHYAEVSRTTHYYRKSWSNSETAAKKKGTKVDSCWQKLGFSTVTLYAYNCGGGSKKKYDGFKAVARVGALGGYYLTNFIVQMRVYNQNKCSIIETSTLKGGDETNTVSIGTEAGVSEEGISTGFSSGYSYSYDPNGLKIKNVSDSSSELIPNWKCSKYLSDCERNEWYEISPMIIVKNPTGSSSETKVSARVKNLHFIGKIKEYDVTNSSGSEYVYLSVKNHKKVDSHS